MPKCTFLVGLPGSGKSTWLAKHLGDMEHTTVLSTDDTIQYIAEEYGMTYDEAFKDLIKFAEKVMWRSVEDALYFQDNIVIDRTNLTAKSRARFIRAFEGYEFEAIVFPTPEPEEWKRRLASREGKTIPQHVLDSMELEYPEYIEGFNRISDVQKC